MTFVRSINGTSRWLKFLPFHKYLSNHPAGPPASDLLGPDRLPVWSIIHSKITPRPVLPPRIANQVQSLTIRNTNEVGNIAALRGMPLSYFRQRCELVRKPYLNEILFAKMPQVRPATEADMMPLPGSPLRHQLTDLVYPYRCRMMTQQPRIMPTSYEFIVWATGQTLIAS